MVPKKGDTAEVFIGEDDLGELTVDDEDGDRSYNFRMVIQVSNDPSFQPVPALTAYLRGKFDNENIRVVTRPKKTDSVEAYIGEEFLGVLFVENEKGRRSYIFELPILDVDLDGGPVVAAINGSRRRSLRSAARRLSATARQSLQPFARKAHRHIGAADPPLVQAHRAASSRSAGCSGAGSARRTPDRGSGPRPGRASRRGTPAMLSPSAPTTAPASR